MRYARISEALRELVFEREIEVDEVMDRYFAPDFRHHNSGTGRSRAEFADMAARARQTIVQGAITVLDELREGLSYAERHTLDVISRNGTRENAEIYIVGRYAPDGRFQSLHEAGFPSDAGRQEGR